MRQPTKRQLDVLRAITRRGLEAIGIFHINQGEVCGWCGAHYFGPECPFARCHEEAVGW